MAERYVLITELGKSLGFDGSYAARLARQIGIEPVLVNRTTFGRPALAVTVAEANKLIASRPPVVEIVNPEELRRKK